MKGIECTGHSLLYVSFALCKMLQGFSECMRTYRWAKWVHPLMPLKIQNRQNLEKEK
jgi:hypothetical protein